MTRNLWIGMCAVLWQLSACTVHNQYALPRAPGPNKEHYKTLVMYVGSNVHLDGEEIEWNPDVHLWALPGNHSRVLNIGTRFGHRYITVVFQWPAADTGTLRLVLAHRGTGIGHSPLYTDTTISLAALPAGTSYVQLNFYGQRVARRGTLPVLILQPIDPNLDTWESIRPFRYKHVLTYNIAQDAVSYSRQGNRHRPQQRLQRRVARVLASHQPYNP